MSKYLTFNDTLIADVMCIAEFPAESRPKLLELTIDILEGRAFDDNMLRICETHSLPIEKSKSILDAASTFLWELAKSGPTVAAAQQILASLFPESVATAIGTVSSFLLDKAIQDNRIA